MQSNQIGLAIYEFEASKKCKVSLVVRYTFSLNG